MIKKMSTISIYATLVMAVMLVLLPAATSAKEMPELQNLASGLSYEWSAQPEPQYADYGNKLTDGKFGALQFTDSPWVGHLRQSTRSVLFDLGEKKSIARVQAHFLQDSASGIAFPNTVSVYVSDDKKKWGTLAHIHNKKVRWEQGPASDQDFVWDGVEDGFIKGNPNATMAYARYVKVTFTTETWVFVDEIEIWGTDGKAKWAKQVPPDHPKYLESGEATGGIRDLALLYNGHYEGGAGDWTKDKIKPYISYVNELGVPQDWLFDGILYLGLRTPQGRSFETGSATLEDWKWYLDKTFAAQGDMQQLNEAVAEARAELGDTDHKVKVVMMIPFTGNTLSNFGDVDDDGVNESFNSSIVGEESAYENQQKAILWWMQQVKQRWEAGSYSNLELTGMYWLSEGIGTSDPLEPNLIRNTSRLVHQQQLKFFWIPYFQGNRNFDWKELGFDAAVLQPNHFFPAGSEPIRIEDAAGLAKQYHMGIEMEFDERMNNDSAKRQRYIDYLNGGIDFGYMNNAFKAYYQGNTALLDSAKSRDPIARQNYDWMYQFVKGTYEKPVPCSKKPVSDTIRAKQLVVKCGDQVTIAHKYNDDYDFWLVFDHFGANKLISFYEWRLAPNNGSEINANMERPSVLLQGDVSDWIGPYIVRANGNGTGHHANFTGGNHAYDGGSTGSATARTDHFKVWADGVELEDGKVIASDNVKIEVVNYIQGYNTKLEDGSGREILQETVTYEISGGKVQVHNEIEALEDITFETYYGLQTVNGGWNDTVQYYAGDAEVASGSASAYSDSGPKAEQPAVDSFLLSSNDRGGKKHYLAVTLDRNYGLGTLQHLAQDQPISFTQDYGKSYFLLIKGTTPELSKGETLSWQGQYYFYSGDHSDPGEVKPTISLDKKSYKIGETITASYTGTSGKDWIGFYKKDVIAGSGNPSITWKYTSDGEQPNGTLTFDTTKLSQPGFYDAILLADDGYEELSRITFQLTE